MVIEAFLAALTGALFFAVAATLQHREASRAGPSRGAVDVRLLWRLVRRPTWLAGVAAAATGGALHVFALSRGPLTLVQPLGVTGLLFAVPLAAAFGRHRVRLYELVAAAVVIAGLGALVDMLPHGAGLTLTAKVPIAGLVLAAGAVAGASAALARRVTGRPRALLLAFAAGTAFGVTSVLVRVLLQLEDHSGVLAPALVAGAGIVVLGPLGLLLLQNAYHVGNAVAALATITVTDPLVAAAGGVVLLHEPLPHAPEQIAVLAVAALCVTVGVGLLARSPAQRAPTVPIRRRWHDDEPVRVLIGTDTYPPDVNGAARFTRTLATGLAARGHDVHVVCPSASGPAETVVEDGVTVHRLRSTGTPFHDSFRICLPWSVASAVRSLLDQVAPDVVHVQGHFLVGRTLLRETHHARVPLVATNHFMPDNLVPYLPVPAWVRPVLCAVAWHDFARLFARADRVTAPTPTAAAVVRAHGVRTPVRAISCGIDLVRFGTGTPKAEARRRLGVDDRPTVAFVGRLDEEKHVEEIIGALRELDAQLVVGGDGTRHADLAERARALGVADRVHLLGFVPDDALPDVYAAADVFAMPGRAELQSIATLEALASGLPVVAVNAVALPHLVHPGDNGYLYEPGDVDELARHLRTILTDPRLRHRMGVASRRAAEAHDAAATVAAFESVYTDVLTVGNLAVTGRRRLHRQLLT